MKEPSTPEKPGGHAPFWLDWILVTLPAVLAAACFDMYTLEVRDSYFSGGFLLEHHLHSLVDVASFVLAATLLDVVFYGGIAALLLALVRRRVSDSGRWVPRLALLVGLIPVAHGAVIYEVLAFVKDPDALWNAPGMAGGLLTSFAAIQHELLRLVWRVAKVVLLLGAFIFVGMRGLWLLVRLRRRTAGPLAPRSRSFAIALLAVGVAMPVVTTSVGDAIAFGLSRKLSHRLLLGGLDWLSDVDRDGYGSFTAPYDTAPWDAAAYPYAIDVPGDGVDQDAIGGDLPVEVSGALERQVVEAGASVRPENPERRRNVIFIALESFRRDVIGRRVGGRPVAPVLERLARQGASAELAYSHQGYTRPSLFAMLTGEYEPREGARSVIDDAKDLGYQVGIFSCADQNFGNVFALTNMQRADVYFDSKSDMDARVYEGTGPANLLLSEGRVNQALAEFLQDGRDPGRPLFIFVNYHSTHYAYDSKALEPIVAPPLKWYEIDEGNKERVVEGYLNAAANVDKALGELLEHLEQAGDLDDALVVITSDHGESLFDGGFLGHGHRLIDCELQIPLIVLNAGAGMDLVEPIGLVELRGLVNRGLSRPASPSPTSFRTDRAKVVFQSIGPVTRPTEIGLQRHDGRIRLSLRQGTLRREQRGYEHEAAWEALPAPLPSDALELVRGWERLRLALENPVDRIASR